jgi:hypothetical protein
MLSGAALENHQFEARGAIEMVTAESDPNLFVSLWVGQFHSRQAMEDYRALGSSDPDDPDAEPTCAFLEDIGLSPGYAELVEAVYEPELWRRGEEAFAALSEGRLFGSGAARLVRELGLVPFDTALLVWGWGHQEDVEPGARAGLVRFVGRFDFLPEPSQATSEPLAPGGRPGD